MLGRWKNGHILASMAYKPSRALAQLPCKGIDDISGDSLIFHRSNTKDKERLVDVRSTADRINDF